MNIQRWRRRREPRSGERGQILVLFTLVIVVILLFASIAIDLGLLRNNRQRLVNALDAAALAGAIQMPVTGAAEGSAATQFISSIVRINFPEISGSDYTISYRCLIGVDPSNNQPFISRDITYGKVCDPTPSLGRAPRASDFAPPNGGGAGQTRWTYCYPSAGDKCNTVVVNGSFTTQYSFGRVVNVNSGSTGAVVSAACNGPCGQPPNTPLDVVVILDRTYSMVVSGNIGDLRHAGGAVLQAYDPSMQHVALGMIGPSSRNSTCSGSPSDVYGNIVGQASAPSYGSSTTGHTTNRQSSFTINRPNSTSDGDLLLAQVMWNGGTGVNVTPPLSGGWTLLRRTDNGTSLGQAIYYKWANGEPINYSWGLSSSTEAMGAIVRYTGVDPNHPFDPTVAPPNVGTGNAGTGRSMVATHLTTSTDNSMIVAFYGYGDDQSLGQPNSMSRRYDVASNNSTQDLAISASDDTVGNAGNTNDRTSTAASGTNIPWVAQMIGLRSATPNDEYDWHIPAALDSWIPIGLTGTNGIGGPAQVNEAYVNPDHSLNGSTHIVKAINCFEPSTPYPGTNLATPMEAAVYYLQHYGRPGVKAGIILETDGYPQNAGTPDSTNYTCYQASTNANIAEAAGIEVYTIGFNLGAGSNCPDGSGTSDNQGLSFRGHTAAYLLSQMASGPKYGPANAQCNAAENTDGDHFFCVTAGADLTTVFAAAATELAGIQPHLVALNPPPQVKSVSPSTGSHVGGVPVTIGGIYFTGATSVKFGGTSVVFSVVDDKTITVTAPGGVTGQTVDVVVTTPNGSSPMVTVDHYTYSP